MPDKGNNNELTFIRHGEIVLLLKPPQIVPAGGLPPVTVADLQGDLQNRLNADPVITKGPGGNPFHPTPLQDSAGNPRPLQQLPRGNNGTRLVQVVNLAGWVSNPAAPPAAGSLRTAVLDVGRVVRNLNAILATGTQQVMVGSYQLDAVAPNWLSMCEQGW